MYMWRSSFADNPVLVELEAVWKRNEKAWRSLERHNENDLYITQTQMIHLHICPSFCLIFFYLLSELG